MNKLLGYLTLPKEISPFEARYLRSMNKVGLGFFWLHPPVFALVAWLAGTSVLVALALSVGVLVGPTLAFVAFRERPRLIGLIYGVTAMLMGGVLVYVGQGPMQIEMHFYFFVLLALLAVFANPLVIVAAAGSAAAHHFAMWLILPRGVFNYEASIWTVVVHAVFVVIESVAACFVARSFFDNVIGLEKIVEKRTQALDLRNRDMARILDNVDQGFASVGFDGAVGPEWSRSLERWFGAPTPGQPIWRYLFGTTDQATWMEYGFDSLREAFMPFEVIVDQLPHRLRRDDRELRVDYQGIGTPATALLIVISDITDEVARQHAERVQRELITVVEKAFRDRGGFTQFLHETQRLVDESADGRSESPDALKRRLHTLKGNTALFGVTSVASLCHELEDRLADGDAPLDAEQRGELVATWASFRDRIERVLGISNRRSLVVDWDEYEAVLAACAREQTQDAPWTNRLREWGKQPTRPRLEQCAEYARSLAARLGKPEPQIEILDHDVRLFGDQFAAVWPAFVHAVRNMVDHGLEPADARTAAGKPARGQLVLESTLDQGELIIAIADDGAGIDWARVAEKARALGVPAGTQAELEEALFTSGVSTAERASEVSGRGVGMDALRAVTRELCGRVVIKTERGRGTRIACVLPLPRPRPARTTLNPRKTSGRIEVIQ